MSKINDGGSAFPHPDDQMNHNSCWIPHENRGMSLRDYFAAKAMQGLMGRAWDAEKFTGEELLQIWARSAYASADAMLKAREAKS